MKPRHIICLITTLLVIGVYWNIQVGFFEDQKEKEVKVGFVYIGDAGNAYTYNFIRAEEEIIDTYGDKVKCIDKYNVPEGEEGEALDALIGEGCNLIFTTSYGYAASVKEYAKKYPNIEFCAATGDNASDPVVENYHTFMGEIYQGRYISGVVAGMKLEQLINEGVITSEEAVLGYIGAFPYAEVISGYTAFILGVRSVVPEATMIVKYSNSWNDYATEKKIAKELIDEGCIIISQHSDTSGAAVVCESTEADKAIFHVGYNQSMMDVAPTTSLIGCRINWGPYMVSAVDAVIKGKKIEKYIDANIHGNDASAGFDKGWVQMLDANNLILADGTVEKIEKIKEDFIDGKIDVFKGDYIGVNPYDPEDRIDLNKGYKENEKSSAPTFNYILTGIVKVEE